MTTSLRLPDELERDLQLLAEKHDRSVHGEMLHALKQYVLREMVPYEVDTLYSQSGELQLWDVYSEGERVVRVQADSLDHACMWVHRTRWITRLKLTACLAEG